MKEENLKLQLKACDYMEETYGKNWEKRLNLSTPAITNAFISGYKSKEVEDKTVATIFISQKRFDKICQNMNNSGHTLNIEELFGLPVIIKREMPNHLGCLVDGEMNVLAFIEFKEKK